MLKKFTLPLMRLSTLAFAMAGAVLFGVVIDIMSHFVPRTTRGAGEGISLFYLWLAACFVMTATLFLSHFVKKKVALFIGAFGCLVIPFFFIEHLEIVAKGSTSIAFLAVLLLIHFLAFTVRKAVQGIE